MLVCDQSHMAGGNRPEGGKEPCHHLAPGYTAQHVYDDFDKRAGHSLVPEHLCIGGDSKLELRSFED